MVRRIARIAAYVCALSALWIIAAPSAHAYIDPGSSSFIIQLLVGVGAGAALAIATFWRRLRAFFARLFGREVAQERVYEPKPTADTGMKGATTLPVSNDEADSGPAAGAPPPSNAG